MFLFGPIFGCVSYRKYRANICYTQISHHVLKWASVEFQTTNKLNCDKWKFLVLTMNVSSFSFIFNSKEQWKWRWIWYSCQLAIQSANRNEPASQPDPNHFNFIKSIKFYLEHNFPKTIDHDGMYLGMAHKPIYLLRSAFPLFIEGVHRTNEWDKNHPRKFDKCFERQHKSIFSNLLLQNPNWNCSFRKSPFIGSRIRSDISDVGRTRTFEIANDLLNFDLTDWSAT